MRYSEIRDDNFQAMLDINLKEMLHNSGDHDLIKLLIPHSETGSNYGDNQQFRLLSDAFSFSLEEPFAPAKNQI
jgi:hypothetical protein